MMMSRLTSVAKTYNLNPNTTTAVGVRLLSTKSGEEEWNDAPEISWLPYNLPGKSLPENPQTAISSSPPETKAFVEEMNDNWEQRKGKSVKKDSDRLTKQRIHARLWAKEIEKLEEAKLGNFSDEYVSFYSSIILLVIRVQH
ncbi:hypothetical protein SASPL_137783 [Salvia splendens]|uniref:Uncharacterized protein n=1 Tax=Salvia splendens TaxID=180675 RepID=A0A8X8WVL9_SALSN|nr:hypothetical protein SASPL_137783 [Salvia splendens]